MCTSTVNEIKADGVVVSNALLALARFEAPLNATAAADLTTAANALLAITNGWSTGSPVAILNDAASAVEVILGDEASSL